jgi:hypothetical protein
MADNSREAALWRRTHPLPFILCTVVHGHNTHGLVVASFTIIRKKEGAKSKPGHGEQVDMPGHTHVNKTPLLLAHNRIPTHRHGILEAAAPMLL